MSFLISLTSLFSLADRNIALAYLTDILLSLINLLCLVLFQVNIVEQLINQLILLGIAF
jgi:hypothetical protein